MLLASLTSLDPLTLREGVDQLLDAGVDGLHIDIADGRFVPFITFSPEIVRSLRPLTDRLLDVHLLVDDPASYFLGLADAGADRISFHVEAAAHPWRTISALRQLGLKVGVALNPVTPVATLELLGFSVDLVNVQSTTHDASSDDPIPGIEQRIRAVREITPFDARVLVDGGVDSANIGTMIEAGATEVVVGRAICRATDRKAAVREIRTAITTATISGGRDAAVERAASGGSDSLNCR